MSGTRQPPTDMESDAIAGATPSGIAQRRIAALDTEIFHLTFTQRAVSFSDRAQSRSACSGSRAYGA
jgi:hypothetical protein